MKNKGRNLILTILFTLTLLASLALADNCTDNDNDSWGDIITNTTPCINQPESCYCGDCNDADSTISPSAPELCNGIDDNCDGNLLWEEMDRDGDGAICEYECNDTDPTIFVGAPEGCNGIDNNCDGNLDEEIDDDYDGFMICEGDCKDDNPDINPNATEICDGIDNNCDKNIDEDFPELGLECGTGACAGTLVCKPDGTGTECDGSSPTTEICDNSIDDDCDGLTDSYDPDCSSQICTQEGDPCRNTTECCDDLKCKKQIDYPRQKICCSKEDCAAADGCVKENICIPINHNRIDQKVCAHGTWIPEKKQELNCNDNIDNDCDTHIDCNDSDCNNKPNCQPTCATDDDCNSKEICKNGKCKRLFCKGCAYPENHECHDWECCTRKDCPSGEMCWKHECITPPKTAFLKNKYIKENAKSAIENAQQNILQKKFSGDKPKNIKTLERKLKSAKTAYNNGEYDKSESLATEITTGKKQKESTFEKIKGFMNRLKSFFMRSKEKENKPYAGSNIIPKI